MASRGVFPSLRSAASAKSIIMMAFFLTMPIRRTMPMMPMMPRSVLVNHEREQRPHPGRRQGGKNRYRMDIALVQDPQYDVDGHDGGEDQQQGARQRGTKGERGALKTGLDADGHADLPFGRFDGVDRVSEGCPARQVERDGCRGKLSEMVDNERRRLFRDRGDRSQGHLRSR